MRLELTQAAKCPTSSTQSTKLIAGNAGLASGRVLPLGKCSDLEQLLDTDLILRDAVFGAPLLDHLVTGADLTLALRRASDQRITDCVC